jgi:hypothetical protein
MSTISSSPSSLSSDGVFAGSGLVGYLDNGVLNFKPLSCDNIAYVDENIATTSPLSDMICIASQCLLYDPVMHTTCQQMYCRHCVESMNWICPVDKENMVHNITAVPKMVTNALALVLCKCTMCDSQMTRDKLQFHISNECAKRTIVCGSRFFGCSWTGHADVAQEHEKTCSFNQNHPVLDRVNGVHNALKELAPFLESIVGIKNTLEERFSKLDNRLNECYSLLRQYQTQLNDLCINVGRCEVKILKHLQKNQLSDLSQ